MAANPLAQALIGTEGLIAPQKPKDLYASLLIKNGLNTAPAGHWTEAAARMAQALLGAQELRRHEADEDQRRAAPDEIAGISGQPSPAPAAAPPMPPMQGAPRPPASVPQNVAGPVPPNDPTMAPSPRQVAMVNGGQPPAANFNDRFAAATAPAPAPVAPQAPAQAQPPQPGGDVDAEIERMRQSKNPYVKAYGNQLMLERNAQRIKPPDLKVIGKDPQGNDQHGWVDGSRRTVTPLAPAMPNFVDTKKLRDEVRDLPSYKNLAQAAPVYKSMFEAAGRDNRAADVNLIYGMAKIMDPGSVVRESEMTIAQAVATLPQQLQSTIMSQLNSTGRLSPEVRAAIMQEAHSRVGAYQSVFDTDMGMYRGIAEQGRFNPSHVIPQFGPFDQFKATPPSGAAPPAGGPQGAPRPRARNQQGQEIEYNGQQWVPVK